MKFKIGQHTLTWIRYHENFSIDEKLDQIRETGYEGVELMEPLEELGSPQDLKKALDKRGLSLASIFTRVGRGDKDVIKESKKRIDYAANFDVNTIVACETLLKPGEKLIDEHYEILGDELESLSEYASKYGMEIAYHTHIGRRVATSEDLKKLFNLAPTTKLCLDTANLAAAGSNPLEVLNNFKDKVIYVQLKDWIRNKQGSFWDQCVELGEGDLANMFPELFRTLEDIGYVGWIIVELDETASSPVESAKISRQFLRKLGY